MRYLITRLWPNQKKSKRLEEKIPGLLDSDSFHNELVKEKLRADRSLMPFTLLLFNVRNSGIHENAREEMLEILGKIIRDSSRGSDTKGWYCNGDKLQLRLGLILNCTSIESSDRIIHAIREGFQDKVSRKYNDRKGAGISCELYTYPNGHDNSSETNGSKAKQNGFKGNNVLTEVDVLARPLPLWAKVPMVD